MKLIQRPSLRLGFAPYARLLKRVLLGPGTADTLASKREILCPEETREAAAPFYLPGQIERLTASTGHRSLQAEIESAVTPTYLHAATIAYHIRNAVLSRGSIYAGSMRHYLAPATPSSDKGDILHFKMKGLASTAVGHTYFGHWLLNDCLQYLLAERHGIPISLGPSQEFHHKEEYSNFLEQDWTPTNRAIVDELIIYQDFSYNSSKLRRHKILSDRLARKLPVTGTRDKLVFLRRGDTGTARVTKNEGALLEALDRSGFEVVDVSAPAHEILRTLRSAKLVISMEGSQISHCGFTLDSGCSLLVLEPSDRFTSIHRHWTDCLGIRFGFVVGERNEGEYQFSVTEILRTAELMLK